MKPATVGMYGKVRGVTEPRTASRQKTATLDSFRCVCLRTKNEKTQTEKTT